MSILSAPKFPGTFLNFSNSAVHLCSYYIRIRFCVFKLRIMSHVCHFQKDTYYSDPVLHMVTEIWPSQKLDINVCQNAVWCFSFRDTFPQNNLLRQTFSKIAKWCIGHPNSSKSTKIWHFLRYLYFSFYRKKQ